jgi:protein-S-isoprenylcysteine O-methyltransferase Ste14
MADSSDQPRHPKETDRRRLVLGVGWTLFIFVLCLFLPAGSWAWARGWLFFLVTVAAGVVITLFLKRVNPEVVAARVNRHGGTKHWDRVLLAIFLPTVMLIPILAALDDGRFHWSHVPWWLCVVGYVLLLAGLAGMTWAEAVNKHFEPTVRIQTDRGHTVIDTGPYALIRHPGYVAASLIFVGIALSLGSLWALIPAILSCLLLVVRTVLEDRTLRAELSGYEEYTHRVRYRLVPGVW